MSLLQVRLHSGALLAEECVILGRHEVEPSHRDNRNDIDCHKWAMLRPFQVRERATKLVATFE